MQAWAKWILGIVAAVVASGVLAGATAISSHSSDLARLEATQTSEIHRIDGAHKAFKDTVKDRLDRIETGQKELDHKLDILIQRP